jgi:hypothetical protein
LSGGQSLVPVLFQMLATAFDSEVPVIRPISQNGRLRESATWISLPGMMYSFLDSAMF